MNTNTVSKNTLISQGLSLHPLHLEDLKRSGLSDETILRAGIRSVPPAEIRKLLGFDLKGLSSAYIIPYDKCFFRLRCFYDNEVEGFRYLQQKNSGNRLYIPPMLDEATLRSPDIPLYITEGEKKALKAVQEGLPCIAVAGLWNWCNGNRELIDDFDRLELKNRKIFMVPDNDWLLPNKHGYQKNLVQAVQRLALKLIERGAEVYLVELPKSEEKIGLDDYLCKHSLDEFLRLPTNQIIRNAESYKKALDILKHGDPLKYVVSELSKEYILREKELALCYLLTLLPKLGENAVTIVTGESSVGKSSLVSTVLKAIPDAYKLLLHSSSSKALLYRNKDLSNMNLWINELSGAIEIVELLKGLMTEKQATHFTVNDSKRGKAFQQFSIKAEGFVCFITSTRETFPEELANRAFIINLRATPEIVDSITRLQAERVNGDLKDVCNYEILVEIYKLIKKLPVEIPFAKEIQRHLDKTKTRITRDFPKVLALIKAHALLNQYKREIRDGKIIANREDYEEIFKLSDLIVESISELGQHHIEFLKACEDWTKRSDVAKLLGKTEKTILNYCKALKDFIEIEGRGSEQKLKAIHIPTRQKALPHPDIIFPFPQISCGEPQNRKMGNFGKNGIFPSNSLKDKGKMQIGKLETENYIYFPPDFWEKVNFDDIEVLED